MAASSQQTRWWLQETLKETKVTTIKIKNYDNNNNSHH